MSDHEEVIADLQHQLHEANTLIVGLRAREIQLVHQVTSEEQRGVEAERVIFRNITKIMERVEKVLEAHHIIQTDVGLEVRAWLDGRARKRK